MPIWKILIWKEWHEHKWKLLALTAIIMSVFLAMLSEDLTMLPGDAGHVVFALLYSLVIYAFFGPLFVGMSVGASEYSTRSIDFVRALPVSIRQAAVVRLMVGLAVIVVPIICCYLCSCLLIVIWPDAGFRGPVTIGGLPESWTAMQVITTCVTLGIAATISAYACVIAVTVNQRTEFRAGLIGLLAVVMLGVLGACGLSGWDNQIYKGKVSIPYLIALMSSPLAFVGPIDFIRHSRSELIFFTLVWQGVLIWRLSRAMINRYGGDGWFATWIDRTNTQDNLPLSCLGPAMRSPWRALFWMQMRQTLPVGLVGFMLVALMFPFTRAVDTVGWHAFVGSVLALIIGIGSFVHELEPKLHTFWRSRPISPAAWYWLKFAAGFFVLVVLYDVPYALLSWSGVSHPFWRSVEANLPILEVCFPILLHLLVYSIAVFAACVIRHSIYSTILALCAVLAILVPPLAYRGIPDWLSIIELWSNSIHHHPHVDLNFSIATALVAAIALPATLLAAWLIKRDSALNT